MDGAEKQPGPVAELPDQPELRGLLLVGGHGTRLAPLTGAGGAGGGAGGGVLSKQLLPVFNKPMVYYPLTVLMLAGVRTVRVVCTPEHRALYEAALGDGGQWGMRLSYVTQPEPGGLAQALQLDPAFHHSHPVCLILGDNLIYGSGLRQTLRQAADVARGGRGAVIFAHRVDDPRRYAVVTLDGAGRPVSLEEKPAAPRSQLAVPGLYFYDATVTGRAAMLSPSPRGELEITDLNRRYLDDGALHVHTWGRGTAWLDAGTHASLLEASNFVHSVEQRQGQMIGSPDEVAYRLGWIDADALRARAAGFGAGNGYGDALRRVADEAAPGGRA